MSFYKQLSEYPTPDVIPAQRLNAIFRRYAMMNDSRRRHISQQAYQMIERWHVIGPTELDTYSNTPKKGYGSQRCFHVREFYAKHNVVADRSWTGSEVTAPMVKAARVLVEYIEQQVAPKQSQHLKRIVTWDALMDEIS